MAKSPRKTQENKPGRRLLYTVITLSIPVLFLVLVETGLRVVGFGSDYPLFVELPQQPDYLQPNPDVIKRFFADPEQAPDISIDTNYFLADKPENGLRFVVQGGSSAAGFPYGRNASLAGMLQQRLAQTFPDRHVEIILTAMSAVNSYTLLDFADEIIAIEPDAVLIYVGHNEFVGILGVGSSFASGHAPAITRLFLGLRELRLVQFMQQMLSVFKGDAAPRTGTLMATIARERDIPLGSQLFERGVTQFRTNLDALLERYQSVGIPVFIGTLASNQKDQPPFMGDPTNPDKQDWPQQTGQVRQLLKESRFAAALEAAQALVRTDSAAADGHYLLGQAQLGLRQFEAAGKSLRMASDLDRLRFRAPGKFDSIIRETAAQYEATLVEVGKYFADASPNGITGSEFMLEHLHPNAPGYLLLADAYYDAMAESGLGLDWQTRVPDERARELQPLSRIEELHGSYRLGALINDWPFVAQKKNYSPPHPRNPEQQIAQDWYSGKTDYLGAMNKALVHYQNTGDYEEAARIAINLADAFPFEAQPHFVAGMMLVKQTPPQGLRAIPLFRRAATLQPGNAAYLETLARAYMIHGFPDEALETANKVLTLAPDNALAKQIINYLKR